MPPTLANQENLPLIRRRGTNAQYGAQPNHIDNSSDELEDSYTSDDDNNAPSAASRRGRSRPMRHSKNQSFQSREYRTTQDRNQLFQDKSVHLCCSGNSKTTFNYTGHSSPINLHGLGMGLTLTLLVVVAATCVCLYLVLKGNKDENGNNIRLLGSITDLIIKAAWQRTKTLMNRKN
ncbi:hypothetical protein F5Y09DRAFT_351150 [Xylaria sp. FL1042]|nr:hypothetical protein F5Y09DRAFT_351150 [Xylaria sp. FL1042]